MSSSIPKFVGNRHRSLANFGIGTLAAAAAIAAAPAPLPLRAMRWLAPGADAARILTTAPAECFSPPKDPEERWRAEVGRAAFRTPLILGGVAARAGLTCETCHKNGRVNRDFDFPGISGAPGTADVRSFLFSPRRGDHQGRARPIPDLGGPKSVLKVSQSAPSGDLEQFIHGLVTEEFDGPEPPPAVLRGLAAYVRALSPAACPTGDDGAARVAGDIDAVRRAVSAGEGALDRRDPATAIVLVSAARSVLGGIAERYGSAPLKPDREALRRADLALAAAASDIRRGDPQARMGLQTWLEASPAWAALLSADERRSYYDRAHLAQAIATR